MARWCGILFLGLFCMLAGFVCWKSECHAYGKFLVPRFSGVVYIVGGFVVIILCMKNIMSKKRKIGQYLICPKCQNVVETFQSADDKCSKCGEPLEDLKGFYERHPEFKEMPKNNK